MIATTAPNTSTTNSTRREVERADEHAEVAQHVKALVPPPSPPSRRRHRNGAVYIVYSVKRNATCASASQNHLHGPALLAHRRQREANNTLNATISAARRRARKRVEDARREQVHERLGERARVVLRDLAEHAGIAGEMNADARLREVHDGEPGNSAIVVTTSKYRATSSPCAPRPSAHRRPRSRRRRSRTRAAR